MRKSRARRVKDEAASPPDFLRFGCLAFCSFFRGVVDLRRLALRPVEESAASFFYFVVFFSKLRNLVKYPVFPFSVEGLLPSADGSVFTELATRPFLVSLCFALFFSLDVSLSRAKRSK